MEMGLGNHKLVFIILVLASVLCSCQPPNVDNDEKVIRDYEEQNIIIPYEDYDVNDQFDDIKNKYSLAEPYSVEADGQDVNVQAYSYKPSDSINTVTFKYCDLINRAISYKQKYPAAQINIDFAIYKIDKNVYIGFNPKLVSYGKVSGYDHSGENSEKLILSVIKAAKFKINTRFIYHNPSDDMGIRDYLNVYSDDLCIGSETEHVSDYLSYKKVSWVEGSSYGQHHNKYLLINYQPQTGPAMLNEVYIASANVDRHDNNGIPIGHEWVQSGILLSGNKGLYDAYLRYFEKIWENTSDRTSFWNAVRYEGEYNHQNANLNYHDEVFAAYFFPIPSEFNVSAWDTLYNPVAMVVNDMKNHGYEKEMTINMYHLKTDTFGRRLYDELKGLDNISIKSSIHRDSNNLAQVLFRDLGELTWAAPTHAKNYTFIEHLPGGNVYSTITGSTHGKWDAYCSKSNNQLHIQETTEPYIHDVFVDIFNYAASSN